MAVNGRGLRWALWDGDNVVFHAETGETHLLSDLPTLVLRMLLAGPLRTSVVSERSAHACSVANDSAWRQKILAILGRLEGLELVERRSDTATG